MGVSIQVGEGRDLGEAPTEAVWDVFLSHATEDSGWADAIESGLSSSSLRVVSSYAAPDQLWGLSTAEIVSEVFPGRCPIALIAFSKGYVSSKSSMREFRAIMAAAHDGRPSLVLPMRIDESPLPDAIRSIAALDVRETPPDEVARRIAARVEKAKRATECGTGHPAWGGPGDSPDQGDEFEKIRKAIDLLGDQERRIIMLYYMENLPSEEVGARVGMTGLSVRLQIMRTLRKLHYMAEFER